jgi:hypothetical protein
MKRSWKKKVKWRIILEISENQKNSQKFIDYVKNQPLCEIKYVPNPHSTVTGIYDQKEAFIVENPKVGLSDSPALWTNNPSLISLAKDYFEILWITASKDPKLYID